jgi:hypothetical protein
MTTYTEEEIKLLRELVDRPERMAQVDITETESLRNALFFSELKEYEDFEENLAKTGLSAWLDKKYQPIVKILWMPLDEMPLLINHDRRTVRILAMWRLNIAK